MVTVVITGFMGTGKTSVGRALAARLGRGFVDTDVLVEERTGRTVSEIFAADGEAAFRAAEQEAVRPLLQGSDPLRRVRQLLAERAPAYAQADLSIDTSDRDLDDVVDEIARFLATRKAGA